MVSTHQNYVLREVTPWGTMGENVPTRTTLRSRLRLWLGSRSAKCVVAAVLLVALYSAADWRAVGGQLMAMNRVHLLLALLMFVPQTFISAVRWRLVVSPLCEIPIGAAIRHTLAASACNLILPSKLGDFFKAAMLPVSGHRDRVKGTAYVLNEKLADVGALVVLLLLGFAYSSYSEGTAARAASTSILSSPFIWLTAGVLVAITAGMAYWTIRSRRRRGDGSPVLRYRIGFISATACLWVLHLVQFDLFLKAVGVYVAWHEVFARVPIAIFAGLLPVTFCGIGTRDAALVWLFADFAPASTMAVVGMLSALRYLIPGACGIALVGRSIKTNDAVLRQP